VSALRRRSLCFGIGFQLVFLSIASSWSETAFSLQEPVNLEIRFLPRSTRIRRRLYMTGSFLVVQFKVDQKPSVAFAIVPVTLIESDQFNDPSCPYVLFRCLVGSDIGPAIITKSAMSKST
jgi:hypothetical protein